MSLKTYAGYHGTDRDAAKRIIKTKFIVNQKHIGWLGTGIYFFEEDKELAKEYAKARHPKKIIDVIECILEVKSDEVFDTTKEDYQKAFHKYRQMFKKIAEKEQMILKPRNSEDLDGKVYDFIANKDKYILFRARTFTPSLLDREEGLLRSRVPNGVELCLKIENRVITKSISK